MSKNIYEQFAQQYLDKNLSVIPDKYGLKTPAIKSWSDYCYRLPNNEEVSSWYKSIPESNISLCLGEISGVIALDIDAEDQRILDIIMPILPESPVAKVGSKGETRFFRFMGEATQILSFNNEVVFEVLSNNKKTTLPPSIHPTTGQSYKWVGKTLLEVDINELPILPPMLVSHIESVLKVAFKDSIVGSHGKVVSGRNSVMSTFCSELIRDRVPVDEAISKLLEHDSKTNETSLFTDPSEFKHTEKFTNALQFYTNHLNSMNTNRFRKNEVYEIPITYSAVTQELANQASVGKSLAAVKPKSLKTPVLPSAKGALGSLIQNVLDNSFVKQPEFAYGAALVTLSTFIARKVLFRGISPNLYVLHIAPSGCGKDAPQQLAKKYMVEVGADPLLGAGDYVSDASLIDNLPNQPVRLDVVDEASGLLKAVNSSRNGFDGKMADILCELYTSSNSKFLGRALANKDGKPVIKGTCYRPNVNLLCSTTPTGFSSSVSTVALDKGLLGRFIIFLGGKRESEAIKEFPKLPGEVKELLHRWFTYAPKENKDLQMGTMVQDATELEISEEADLELSRIFKIFDKMRMDAEDDEPMLPVIARLYQQMVKIIIIHTCGKYVDNVPKIELSDVQFGYDMIQYLYTNMKNLISQHLFNSSNERLLNKILSSIKSAGEKGICKTDLYRKTRAISSKQREELLKELEEAGLISTNLEVQSTKRVIVYRSIEDGEV